jgi:hypothetical protein
MCARKEIRSLTYSTLAIESDFSNRKWKHPNDEVFNKLGELMQDTESGKTQECEKIADFLNLFYYFIICYSKKCFKKDGIWNSSRYKFNFQVDKKLSSQELIRFNYELANENDSHSKLLEIQQRMNRHRQEFKYAVDNDKLYFTDGKKQELKLFIEESLEIICTDIQEPVVMTSYDIKSKIAKYTEDFQKRKKNKKSPKLNYAVLEALGFKISC